jgi:hypothetical protein
MPFVGGEDVRTPLGASRVVIGIGHISNPVKSPEPCSPAGSTCLSPRPY